MRDGALAINFLLADTVLFGGTKVALQQANLLARRGHAVTVVAPAPPPDWFELTARYLRVAELAAAVLPAADVNVATFWTTLRTAADSGTAAVHYCQGFEADYTHNRGQHAAILEAYATPLPAFVVSPHLAELLRRRFGRPALVLPQPLGEEWRPRRRQGPLRPPRILLVSPFEIDWKGVATGLRAVRILRESGFSCRLVRVSQWPLGDAERRLLEPDEYHCGLRPAALARLMAGCDLLLAPSWEQEGFGLPALEAMACGLPVVASDVSCYRAYARPAARIVPFDDPAAFAAAARELLQPPAWRRARRAGLAVAAGYGETIAADAAEQGLGWVVEGRWRTAS